MSTEYAPCQHCGTTECFTASPCSARQIAAAGVADYINRAQVSFDRDRGATSQSDRSFADLRARLGITNH